MLLFLPFHVSIQNMQFFCESEYMEDADIWEDELYFSEEADCVYTVHFWVSNFYSHSTQWKLCLFAKGYAKEAKMCKQDWKRGL